MPNAERCPLSAIKWLPVIAKPGKIICVQEARLDPMIFDIPRQVECCSSFTRLKIGDVIVTGTPGGVGAKRNPPLWLKPGDTVEVGRIALLRNGNADEAA